MMDYYYWKIDLLKIMSMDSNEDVMVDEIWLGLPLNFHVHLQYNHVKNYTLSQFGQLLGDKDSQFDRKDKSSGQGWNNVSGSPRI